MTDIDSDYDNRIEPVPEGMGTVTRVLATIFVVGAAAFWIYAFSPWARGDFQAPDQLADEGLVETIDARCKVARDIIVFDLPQARDSVTPTERAESLALANDVLRDMVDDLTEIQPVESDDQRLLSLWLQDWDVYLGDRTVHVDRLQNEGDVRFLNTDDGGVFIHARMDGFARVNNMDFCETPGDV